MHQYHLDAFTCWRFRGRTPGLIEVVSAHGKTQIQRFTVTVEKLPVGQENDTFAYRATSESQPGSGKFDTITDFTSLSDKFDFSAITGINVIQGSVSAGATINAHSVVWVSNVSPLLNTSTV